MIKKLTFCIMFLYFSCESNKVQLKKSNINIKDTNIENNNLVDIDTILHNSIDNCIYDTSLNGVQIEDKISVVKFLKKVNCNANKIGESIIILNEDSTIFFQIHQEPGGLRFEADILSIGYFKYFSVGNNITIKDLDTNYNKIYVSKLSKFISEKDKFYLGMTEDIFLKIVDLKCFNKIDKNNFTYYNGITLIANNFIFKNGILIYFEISYIV